MGKDPCTPLWTRAPPLSYKFQSKWMAANEAKAETARLSAATRPFSLAEGDESFGDGLLIGGKAL